MWGLAKRGMSFAAGSGEQGSWSAVLSLAYTSVIERFAGGLGYREGLEFRFGLGCHLGWETV